MEQIMISADPALLDVPYITGCLSATYWAKGRTEEKMRRCIANSLNYGIYRNGVQIGYARVVTDYSQFAYMMDVFIDAEQRSKGYGTLLVNHILADPKLSEVTIWRLATTNAHRLYEKSGFRPLSWFSCRNGSCVVSNF
jgi:GNAT superfamily N-acetyltransferase